MKKILIVEDVDLNLELLIQLLDDEYNVIAARDGQEGMTMADSERPDLILMDMSLPVIDGWEATQQIKTSPELKHIPIIGLSAHAMSGDAEKAKAAGCDDYMTKPLDEDLLFDKLDHYLG
jgi:two-component system cell cycle response regulator DivK